MELRAVNLNLNPDMVTVLDVFLRPNMRVKRTGKAPRSISAIISREIARMLRNRAKFLRESSARTNRAYAAIIARALEAADLTK